MRRADAEKPGCLISKNLTKTSSCPSEHKEQPENFYPHLQIFYRQHIHVYIKANIYVLQSDRSPTANPSPAALPGLVWRYLMWIHGSEMHEFRPSTRTFLSSPVPFGSSAPSPRTCRRGRGRQEGQAAQEKPVGSAAAILLQSVCTHTSVGKRERMETARASVCMCVCVCDAEREGEHVILWYLSEHKQSVVTWFGTHLCLSLCHCLTQARRHAGRVFIMRSCVSGCHRITQLHKLREATRLERQQRRPFRCIVNLAPTPKGTFPPKGLSSKCVKMAI